MKAVDIRGIRKSFGSAFSLGPVSLGIADPALFSRWFEMIVVASAAVLALGAYGLVLLRIRSGTGPEGLGDPLTPR